MVGENELRRPLAHLQNLGVLGRDHHPVGGGRGAGGGQAALTVDLDDTQAARAVRFKRGVIAERRHVDLGGATGVEHRLSIFNRDRAAVNFQVQHGYPSSCETIVLP